MAFQILTTAELDNYLKEVTRRLNKHCVFCGQNAEIMYKTGMRFAELTSKNWSHLGTKIKVQLPKGERYFEVDEIPEYLNRMVLLFGRHHSIIDYSTFIRKFKLFRPYPIFLGEKEILADSYRHLYAKKLKENGKTDEEIKDILGEKTQLAANHYIYSIIYKKDET